MFFKQSFLKKFLFIFLFILFFLLIIIKVFYYIFFSDTVIISYGIHPFDICIDYPLFWKHVKIFYIIFFIISNFIISNFLYSIIFKITPLNINFQNNIKNSTDDLNLLIGENFYSKEKIFLNEYSLYQNILITGTIGSGKTSSAMYPFAEQLIKYKNYDNLNKLGMLILDVKGNFYLKILEYVKKYNREKDLIIISLNSLEKYNPLDKPNLKPLVLANRLKNILTLFSPNNSESYWLDKVEQILSECIKFCRLYNDGYVSFEEIHKLINFSNYYFEKIIYLRQLFLDKKLYESNIYDLISTIDFFEKEFYTLDNRTFSILKSEITRITYPFVSDYDVLKSFSPPKEKITFNSFKNVIDEGKIVVLSMNIYEYTTLSKLIATYLKLDFQTEVINRLKDSYNNNFRKVCFISDEYHEYITSTDANFFAQSREAKCINIVATQSYSSLINSINNENTVKVIIQNLINKLWFRTDDIFTIESAQKQIGKKDKIKLSKSISENAKETNFNYLTHSFISKNSNLSETINTSIQNDFIFDTNFFTQNLENFNCLAFLSDGNKIFKPTKLKMYPYFLK